jgi:hypothetical protein
MNKPLRFNTGAVLLDGSLGCAFFDAAPSTPVEINTIRTSARNAQRCLGMCSRLAIPAISSRGSTGFAKCI